MPDNDYIDNPPPFMKLQAPSKFAQRFPLISYSLKVAGAGILIGMLGFMICVKPLDFRQHWLGWDTPYNPQHPNEIINMNQSDWRRGGGIRVEPKKKVEDSDD